MTPDERKLLTELFERVRSAAGNRRDPESEAFIADQVRAQPYAPYLLAQAVIVQEEGLKNAAARIEELERELDQARANQGSGGFLGSIFGGGSRSAPPRERDYAPPPPPPQQQPSGPWGHQRGSVPQAGGWGGQQMQQQPAQGGSFLRGALGTAAGVAGGVLLANSLQGLFSGGKDSHGIAGDTSGAGASNASASNDITGGVFDNKQQPEQSGGADVQPASYDDTGGWDSGGDDSWDA